MVTKGGKQATQNARQMLQNENEKRLVGQASDDAVTTLGAGGAPGFPD